MTIRTICPRACLFLSLVCGLATVVAAADAASKTPHFRKHVIVDAAKGAVNSAVASDFNGDGQIDVIASYDRAVHLLTGPDFSDHVIHRFGAGLSRNKPGQACIHSCLLDVDRDGDLDFCGSNQTVFWLECPDAKDALSQWKYRTIDDEILGTHCLITGDVDQDGFDDLIANSFQGPDRTSLPNSLVWLKAPKNVAVGAPWKRFIFADGNAPGGSHYFGFGDINGDGRPDISCAAKGTDGFVGGQWFAWWQQPADLESAWQRHDLATDQEGATNIHPVEVNGDGVQDLIATRGHGQGVLWFRGPEFQQIEIDTVIVRPHSLVTDDLDGDGDTDIAVCGSLETGTAAWYQNDGKGNFTKHVIDTDQSCYDLRAVDMDADGDLDLLSAGHFSKNIVWYENIAE